MSAVFYSEHLNIDLWRAELIANFIELTKNLHAIDSARPWADKGYARVYIDLWSQNRLEPLAFMVKCYYDADHNEVYMTFNIGGKWSTKTLKDEFYKPSGAKTRKALEEFRRVFYEQKVNWD